MVHPSEKTILVFRYIENQVTNIKIVSGFNNPDVHAISSLVTGHRLPGTLVDSREFLVSGHLCDHNPGMVSAGTRPASRWVILVVI